MQHLKNNHCHSRIHQYLKYLSELNLQAHDRLTSSAIIKIIDGSVGCEIPILSNKKHLEIRQSL